MKVSDFQKCLRAMAELISTKAPAKELTAAADALNPFATSTMEQFATFLQLAAGKYGSTGELPDGKPPKPAPAPRAPKETKVVVPVPTVAELVAAVAALKVRLRTDQSLTRDGVAAAIERFAPMKNPDLFAGVKQLGIQTKPKSKGEAVTLLVTHTLAAQSGVARSDA